MNVEFAQFLMTFRLWPTIVVIIGLGLLLGLGTWQLQRAAEKQRLLAEYERKTQSDVIALKDGVHVTVEMLHLRPVTASGTLDGDHAMLLDNRIRDSVVGYDVLVPLKLEGSGIAVLINRGWLARGAQRTIKPALEHPTGNVKVHGTAVRPNRAYRLGGMLEPNSHWPHIVQFVALDEMQALLGYRLLPVVLRLAADDPLALRTGWPIVTLSPQRHYGYAVQWYGLAAALLIIYLVAATRRRT